MFVCFLFFFSQSYTFELIWLYFFFLFNFIVLKTTVQFIFKFSRKSFLVRVANLDSQPSLIKFYNFKTMQPGHAPCEFTVALEKKFLKLILDIITLVNRKQVPPTDSFPFLQL